MEEYLLPPAGAARGVWRCDAECDTHQPQQRRPGTNLLSRTNGNQCLAAQTGCWCKLPSYLIQLLVGPGQGQGGEMG